MISVASAIDEFSVSVTLERAAEGSYDANGNYVAGAETSNTIWGVVQPIKGQDLRDMPEGVRDEARYSIWSRVPLQLDDVITYAGVSYRALLVWPRPIDGEYFKAALGIQNA